MGSLRNMCHIKCDISRNCHTHYPGQGDRHKSRTNHRPLNSRRKDNGQHWSEQLEYLGYYYKQKWCWLIACFREGSIRIHTSLHHILSRSSRKSVMTSLVWNNLELVGLLPIAIKIFQGYIDANLIILLPRPKH
jgi:hypothetical protein